MAEHSKKLAIKVREWLGTPEGKNSIKLSISEAKENTRKFKVSLKIDPRILKEPYII